MSAVLVRDTDDDTGWWRNFADLRRAVGQPRTAAKTRSVMGGQAQGGRGGSPAAVVVEVNGLVGLKIFVYVAKHCKHLQRTSRLK